MALSSISIIPEADKLFDRKPAYTMDQLVPVALISADPTIFVVRADRPWKSVKEFVEDAKKRPDQISYSSSGIYGTLHMAMELFVNSAGIKLKHVPYGGAGPALTAILGGPRRRAGLRARRGPAAHQGRQAPRRSPAGGTSASPRCPSSRRSRSWATTPSSTSGRACSRPSGTPEPILKKLRDTVRAAMQDADFKSAMDKLETPIAYLDAPEFQKFWDKDAKMLADAIKRVGKIEETK